MIPSSILASDFEVGECWGYNRFFRLDLLVGNLIDVSLRWRSMQMLMIRILDYNENYNARLAYHVAINFWRKIICNDMRRALSGFPWPWVMSRYSKICYLFSEFLQQNPFLFILMQQYYFLFEEPRDTEDPIKSPLSVCLVASLSLFGVFFRNGSLVFFRIFCLIVDNWNI